MDFPASPLRRPATPQRPAGAGARARGPLLRRGTRGSRQPVIAGLLVLAATHGLGFAALTDDPGYLAVVLLTAVAAGGLLSEVTSLAAALAGAAGAGLAGLALLSSHGVPFGWGATAATTAIAGLLCALLWVRGRAARQALQGAHEAVASAVVCDYLTGLSNRRGLTMLGGQLLEGARRSGDAAYCLVLQIDGSPHSDDPLHQDERGDEVRLAVADALRAVTRDSDVVARWGDATFVVVGSGPGTGALDLERRMRERLQAGRAGAGGTAGRSRGSAVPQVTVAAAMLAPWDEGSLATLLDKAHAQLYARHALRGAPPPPLHGGVGERPGRG